MRELVCCRLLSAWRRRRRLTPSALPAVACRSPGALILASGAADNTVRVWALSRGHLAAPAAQHAKGDPWTCVAVLQGHTAPVTALACYSLDAKGGPGSSDGSFLLVSTAGKVQ